MDITTTKPKQQSSKIFLVLIGALLGAAFLFGGIYLSGKYSTGKSVKPELAAIKSDTASKNQISIADTVAIVSIRDLKTLDYQLQQNTSFSTYSKMSPMLQQLSKTNAENDSIPVITGKTFVYLDAQLQQILTVKEYQPAFTVLRAFMNTMVMRKYNQSH